MPWHIDYIPEAIFFMTFGYCFKGKIEEMINKHQRIFVACGVVAYIVLTWLSSRLVNGEWIIVLHYLKVSIGIGVLICFFKHIHLNKYTRLIGENTLLCFAYHGKILQAIQLMLKKIVPDIYWHCLDNVYLSVGGSVIITIIIAFIMIPMIIITLKYVPFLAGKKRSKPQPE